MKFEKFNGQKFSGISKAMGGQGPTIVNTVSITTNRTGDDNQRRDADIKDEIPSSNLVPDTKFTYE